jgi:hypothetical protein
MGNTLAGTLQGMMATFQGEASSPQALPDQGSSPPGLAPPLVAGGEGGPPISAWTPENYPVNIREAIETLGGNGTTTQLANTLTAYATQLLEDGAITPDQFNALINLSQSGHTLANVQQKVENAAEQASGNGQLLKTLLAEEGISLLDNPEGFQVQELSPRGPTNFTLEQKTEGLRNNYEDPVNGLQVQYGTFEVYLKERYEGLQRSGLSVDAFEHAYAIAQEQGALADPRVQELISFLANDIHTVSKAVGRGLVEVDAISKAVDVTRGNSQVICTTGNGDSSEEVTCRPRSGT